MRPPAILRLALVVSATLLVACTSPAGNTLSIADAWVRPAAPGAETAAYFSIRNTGTIDDALVSISTPDASMAELHETSTDSTGMTGMAPIDELPIPAGKTVALAPGATHAMLTGLTHALTAGSTVELRLVFRHAGSVTVQATVRQG